MSLFPSSFRSSGIGPSSLSLDSLEDDRGFGSGSLSLSSLEVDDAGVVSCFLSLDSDLSESDLFLFLRQQGQHLACLSASH